MDVCIDNEMEANMKNICDGTQTKDTVLRQVVHMYRDAFIVADQQSLLFERVCHIQ